MGRRRLIAVFSSLATVALWCLLGHEGLNLELLGQLRAAPSIAALRSLAARNSELSSEPEPSDENATENATESEEEEEEEEEEEHHGGGHGGEHEGGGHGGEHEGGGHGGEHEGGEHEGGEHEGGEHEGGEHAVNPVSVASGALLLGTIVFVMSLFYLVHAPSRNIRGNTWMTLDSTISIFIAVMVYQAMDSILDHADLGHARIIIALVHMIFWWVGVLVTCNFLSKTRGSKHRLKAAETIGAHMCAFALKSVFVSLYEIDAFEESAGLHVVAVLLCFVFTAIVFGLGWGLRKALHLGHSHFAHAWEEIENDAACLALAWVVGNQLRFLILGEMPAEEFDQEGHDTKHNVVLVVMTVLSMFLVFSSYLWERCLPERPTELAECFFAMFFSWNMLYLGSWVLYASSWAVTHPILSQVVLATFMTGKCATILMLLDVALKCLPPGDYKKAIHAILVGQGLTVAFSWEQCFHHSIHIFWHGEGAGMKEPLMKLGLVVFFAVVLLPAYVLYIMPKVEDAEKTQVEAIEAIEEEVQKAESETKEAGNASSNNLAVPPVTEDPGQDKE